MGLSKEQVNQLFTGETRDLINMNHLECRGDSVIYVCFQKETIVKVLKEIDNLKERQLEVFMYVELSPKFRLLISYLMENRLPLYQIIQSPNPSVYAPVIEYDSGSLKHFGSLAEDSRGNAAVSPSQHTKEQSLSPKYLGEAKVQCPDTVNVGTEFSYYVTIPEDSTFQETVLPPFDKANVIVIEGPALSTFKSFSLIDGKMDKTYGRRYQYIISCNGDKNITIPSYTIKSRSNGDYYSVPERTIVCFNQKHFGSLAEDSRGNAAVSLSQHSKEQSLSPKCLGEAKVQCPDTVNVGTEFSYYVTIPEDSTFQETVLPPFDKANVIVIKGPALSTFTSISIINGKRNETHSRKYKYILIGESEKHIIIPSYTIKSRLSGDYYTVPERTIVCTKDYCPADINKDTNGTKQLSGNHPDTLFVHTTVDRKDVSINDSVLVTTRLYITPEYTPTLLQILQRKNPDYCFYQPIKQDSISMARDTLNGIEYNSYVIDSYWLHPCKTGIIEIPSTTYTVDLMVRDKSEDPIEAFFNGGGMILKKESCKTNCVSIKVKASPSIKQSTLPEHAAERNGVVYALDISGSMGTIADFDGTRLEMAKDVIRKSCHDETTIIPFAENKTSSIDLPKMSHLLDTITQSKTDGGTALYDLCMSMVVDSTNKFRDIVIYTDGMDNSSHISLKTIVDVMQQHGVRVSVVSINSEKDSVLCISQVLDSAYIVKNEQPLESDLLYLTSETGGQWIKCKNKNEIENVVKQIAAIPSRPYERKKSKLSANWFCEKLKNYYCRLNLEEAGK